MSNASIHTHFSQNPHPLNNMYHALQVSVTTPNRMAPNPSCVNTPSSRDPYLHLIKAKPLAYIDKLVDGFMGASQGPTPLRHKFHWALFHSIDSLFHPLGVQYNPSKNRLSP